MATMPITLKSLEDGRIQLSGGTYPIKDQIRAHGGRWNPVERVWTLPAGTDTSFVVAAPAAPAAPVPVVAPSVAPPKLSAAAEAVLQLKFVKRPAAITAELADYLERTAIALLHAPRRRDGRCCDHATAFWPADDHYGPACYRCLLHGETRGTYSGT